MRFLRRTLLGLCIFLLMGFSAFAGDCHELAETWFGADGNDASVLSLESLEEAAPEVDSLLDVYFAGRAGAFTPETSVHGGGTDSLFSEESDRAALIAGLESRINSVITDASVTSFVTGLEETETGYIATVYEWTFFDYDDLSDGVGGSDTAGFGVEHTITFAYADDGALEIVSDEYTESDVLTGIVLTEDENLEVIMPEEGEGDTLSAVTFDSDYDAVKTAIYANTWVTQEDMEGGKDPSYYNPDYANFAAYGGDCANFVSQSLYAGDMDMVTSGSYPWYYKSASSYTYAWTHCYYQTNHFKNRGNYVSSPTDEDIFPGTACYYGSSHVTICVGHNSAGKAVINGHTSDRYRVPWDYSVDTVTHAIQMTETVIDDLTFEADDLYAYQQVSIPLYAHYQDTTSATSVTLTKGSTLSILTTFTIGSQQWFACERNGTVYYGKFGTGLILNSVKERYTPTVSLKLSSRTLTTNDYLTVTAQFAADDLSLDAVSSATLTLTDAMGDVTTVTMTCSGGVATAKIDCQDIPAGTLRVQVTCSGAIYTGYTASSTAKITAVNTVSGYSGDTLLWTLNKSTGKLEIYENISSADYLRFADKIKSVWVYPNVTSLPSGAFSGCSSVAAIYGQLSSLSSMAEALSAEYVELGYFMDVSASSWAFAEINEAYEKGLVNGTGNYMFNPLMTMDRASFVTVLGRMAGVDATAYSEMTFTDVPANKYYTGYVAWAAECGIVTGISVSTFAPEETITREQAATIISRYLEVFGLELPDAESPTDPFPDMDSVGEWAAEHVELLRVKGIINGRGDGSFDPLAVLTREEATALLLRVYNACAELG